MDTDCIIEKEMDVEESFQNINKNQDENFQDMEIDFNTENDEINMLKIGVISMEEGNKLEEMDVDSVYESLVNRGNNKSNDINTTTANSCVIIKIIVVPNNSKINNIRIDKIKSSSKGDQPRYKNKEELISY